MFVVGSEGEFWLSSVEAPISVSCAIGSLESGLGARIMGMDASGDCATSDKEPFCVGEELRLPAKEGRGGCNTTQTWEGDPSWCSRRGELARGVEGVPGVGFTT